MSSKGCLRWLVPAFILLLAAAGTNGDTEAPYVVGQLVLKMAGGADVSTVLQSYNLTSRQHLAQLDVYEVDAPAGADVVGLAEQISTRPDVAFCHPNFVLDPMKSVQSSLPISDEKKVVDYKDQPAVAQLHLEIVHNMVTGRGVKIAVLDGGAEFSHPGFSGSVVSGYDYVDDDPIAADEPAGNNYGHGTFVAGIIHLVAPEAQIRMYRVSDINGDGDGYVVAEAILRAVQDGCKVINLSMVMRERHEAVAIAIAYARAHDVLIIAAAGNGQGSLGAYPANDDNVLSVASVDPQDHLSGFSNYGTYIDLAAPGEAVVGPYRGDTYALWGGTSFAAPFVAGQAVLIAQLDPGMAWQRFFNLIVETASNIDNQNQGYEGQIGHGLANPLGAANAVFDGELTNLTFWPANAGGNDHWYAVIPQLVSWNNASLLAPTFRLDENYGYLATITSAAENDFILNNIVDGLRTGAPLNQFNVGGYYPIGSPWLWLTGEPVNFTNWGLTEPNNLGVENAVTIWGTGETDPRRVPGTWNNVKRFSSSNSAAYNWSVVEFGGFTSIVAPDDPLAEDSAGCGNVDRSAFGTITDADLSLLSSYMFERNTAIDASVADLDEYAGITNNDLLILGKFIFDPYHQMPCNPINPGPFPLALTDTIFVSSLTVPPNMSAWDVEIQFKTTQPWSGASFTFTYSDGTSNQSVLQSIELSESITVYANVFHDVPGRWVSIVADRFYGTEVPAGQWSMATLHFANTSSPSGMTVFIDTLTLPRGQTTVLSHDNGLSPRRPYLVGTQFQPDRDHDGIANNLDNCPSTANPDQLDRDGDGVGDVCDDCPDYPNPCVYSCVLSGDFTGNGIADIGDLTSMADYLYLHGAPPQNPLNADCDGVAGITPRDLMFLSGYLFPKNVSLSCPPVSNVYPPSDNLITLDVPGVFPAGTQHMALPLWVNSPVDIVAFSFPLQLRVGSEVPVIDSFVQSSYFSSSTSWFIKPENVFSVKADSGIAMIAGSTVMVTDVWLPAGYNQIGTLYISVPASAEDRTIGSAWGKMYPIHPLPFGYPEVGLLPQVVAANHPGGYMGKISANDVYPQYTPSIIPSGACCIGLRGNVDRDPQDRVDISDLTVLVNSLFISLQALPCPAEANINGDPNDQVDIADLTYLISYLFVSFAPLPACGESVPSARVNTSTAPQVSSEYVDGKTIVTISSEFPLRGVQLELNGESLGSPTSLANDAIDMAHGVSERGVVVGLFDYQGTATIPAGVHQVISIEGRAEVNRAIVSDLNHTSWPVALSAARVDLPSDYALAQNHPNPFNPVTTIAFGLPVPGHVNLTIYNISGQRVTTLVDEDLPAGWQSRTWNAGSVASGVYFYRLTTDSYSETKKMLLLK